jgi:hypothetical protein
MMDAALDAATTTITVSKTRRSHRFISLRS